MDKTRRNFLYTGTAFAAGTLIAQQSITAGLVGVEDVDCRRKCPYCGVKDNPKNAIQSGRSWNKTHLKYYIAGRDLRDMPAKKWDEQFKNAFNSWAEVSPLTFEQVDGSPYDIIIDVSNSRRESFGQRGGVLAWAQLPPTENFGGVLLTKFDLAESWVTPEEKGGVVLRAVAAHEIGHLLGLGHSEDSKALMWPYVNGSLGPQTDDITKIQAIYGGV